MSVLKSMHGVNGLFVSPVSRERRMDLVFNIGRSAGVLLVCIAEKFDQAFANAFVSNFSNWNEDMNIEDLYPDPVTVIERTIIESQIGLTKSDVRDHINFFYGREVAEKFDQISRMSDNGLRQNGEYPPLLALMFVGHFLISLGLEPVEPKNPLVILFVANESFERRMKA